MKSVLLTPLCLLLIVMAAHARHRAAQSDDVDLTSDNDDSTRDRVLKHREHSTEQLRNRRRRWQSNYGYDYPPPHYSDYPHRRYDNRQESLMPEILRLLDEIAAYVKRPSPPPPPPQPIYVPYPVPYPVLQNCNCKKQITVPPNLNFTSRFPDMEDPRQNWGIITSDAAESKLNDEDYVDDSIRPVGFSSNSVNYPSSQSSVNVQRNSAQAGRPVTGQASRGVPSQKRTTDTQQVLTGACDAATLSCCKPRDSIKTRADCFVSFGCGGVFRKGETCSEKNIHDVLDRYSRAYSRL